jgi:cytochrome c peroxidase
LSPLLQTLAGRGEARDSSRRDLNAAFSNIGKALAAFESTLVRDDAPFDEFAEGLATGDARKLAAMTESAKRGLKLFIGRGNCILCHTGPEFTDEVSR